VTDSEPPGSPAGVSAGRAETPAARARPSVAEASRRKRFFVVLFVVIALILVGALLWWLHARNYEGTDDAFVDARIAHLSSQISGRVSHVYVSDNMRVRVGQLLLELDPADTGARYQQVQAQEAQARAQLTQAQAQVLVGEAGVAQASASEAGAAAEAANAARDLARYRGLQQTMPAAVADQQLEQAQTTSVNLAAQRKASAMQVEAAQKQVTAAQSQVTGAQAQLLSAQAQLAQARLNLGYTRVDAPIDGTIAQQSVAVGNYVQPGQQLLAIVPLTIWVTANFKETQLTLMRPGQQVDLEIYAYPSVHFTGHIDSIQRGAGQAFSLLPAQNATGNFVKVVQRVPVKIIIDGPSDQRYVLGPGMSVYATVHVR